MKRLALYLGIVATLAASCTVQEMELKTFEPKDGMFYATFEQPGDAGTRVYANEDLLLRWTADDRVSIFNKNTYNQQYKFTGATGDNSGGFDKLEGPEFVTGNAISHVVSVYPYDAATRISESETISLTLPAEQPYAENTFGLGASTMVSVSSDNFLQYKNVGGFLRVTLFGPCAVFGLELRGNNGEKLAGNATVSMPVDGVPTLQLADDATDVITLKFERPVSLSSDSENGTDFWFVLPPVTFSKGFTITVDTGRIPFKQSTSKSVTIERNKLSKMSPFEVVYQPKNVIYYQSTDLNVVVPHSPNGFGEANIIGNEFHENGQWGALIFDKEVTSVGAYAFYNCSNLVIINLPDGVSSLGFGAFNNCVNLLTVNMSVNCPLTSIEASTFQGCKNMSGMVIPFSVTSIGNQAFDQCSKLSYLIIPDSVTSIGDSAFNQCSSLAKVKLPAALTSIGASAFYNCSSLKELTIPADVTNLGMYAFMNCVQLTKITVLPDTPPAGDGWMFSSTNECPIFVPAGSVEAYKSASAWSEYAHRIQAPRPTHIRYTSSDGQIVEPRIPQNLGANIVSNEYTNGQGVITLDGVVTIFENNVFVDCPTLTSIEIPESVVRIENSAFWGCTGLESVSLPEGLTFLGGGAFSRCSSLKDISIPNSVTTIDNNAFQDCSSLEYVSLPESLNIIGGQLFQNCSSLTEISIPQHVTEIGHDAFNGCTSLASVSIPESVYTIGNSAFMGCTSLASVTIPESVYTIGNGAFGSCTSLTSITIPKNVSQMDWAFVNCTNLETVTVLPYYPPSAWGAFRWFDEQKENDKITIYVPEGRVDAYKSANHWSEYADRITAIQE